MAPRAASRPEGPVAVQAADTSSSQHRRELRRYSLPMAMLNYPSSWLWYGRRAQQPPFARISRPPGRAQHAAPAAIGARNRTTCQINGCGKVLPPADAAAVEEYAMEHLRLIRPWTSVMIHAGQLTANELQQYSGCCEGCGETWPARRFLAEHATGDSSACREATGTGPISAQAHAKCCVLRDQTERSLPQVSIKAAEQPIIRVEWSKYPAGLPISRTSTAYILSSVGATGSEQGTEAPVAVYRPVPIGDVLGTTGEFKAAHVVIPRPLQNHQGSFPSGPQPGQAAALPPPPAIRTRASSTTFEFLLVSPHPFPARQQIGAEVHTPQTDKIEPAPDWNGELEDEDETGSDGDEQTWSDSVDGE